MNQILDKRVLAPKVTLLEVHAPRIQQRWKAGQFIIVRPHAESERIPLTLVMSDAVKQSITLVVQAVGKTSEQVSALEVGGEFAGLVGPLGTAATITSGKRVVCMAGGVGVAELLPVAKAFHDSGNHVTALCGARSENYRILDAELHEACDEVRWATDDGSFGFHGNVVQLLKEISAPGQFDEGHVIGPIPMMKAAADATCDWGIKLHASLNPIMIDGTGMCGGCRVTVGGEVKFACVDGPEFDGHLIDYDELARRNRAYASIDMKPVESHECRIGLNAR